MDKKLYRWQKDCLLEWEKNHRRGIMHVVTGAGKTVLALAAIEQARGLFPELMVRIVVPTIPLARQWETSLRHSMKSEEWRPGLYGAGRRDDPDRHVMIYIINSARDSLSKHIKRDLALKRHVLLICDECHHYQSRENRKIFSFRTQIPVEGTSPAASPAETQIPEQNQPPGRIGDRIDDSSLYMSLGLSATPLGTANDAVLLSGIGPVIYEYGFDEAVTEGVISPFTVCEVSASFYAEEGAQYALLTDRIRRTLAMLYAAHPKLKELKEKAFLKTVSRIATEADMDPDEPAAAFLILTYQRKEVSNLARARLACCLSILQKLREDDRVLIFCERISQAEEMTGQIRREFGNICGIYHSQLSAEARKRTLTEFRENRTRILVSCRCLDEGIDVPDANIGIVMSSTAVERQRIQRLGRVIRRTDNKQAACLYYIYIRESTDDAAYLPSLEECDTFSLRYYPAEKVFANDLYEYAAAQILASARHRRYDKKQTEELRRCMEEGLARADYLLPEAAQESNRQLAKDRHSRNYWAVMKRIGAEFRERQD